VSGRPPPLILLLVYFILRSKIKKEKRENMKNKSVIFVVILTFSIILSSVSVTLAHDPPWNIPTFTYISTTPNPIGVNQEILVIMWLDQGPPTADGAYGDRWTFSLEITKPDGTKETVNSIISDPVGSAFHLFTPTQIGSYTLVAKFQEHLLTGLPRNPGPGSYPANYAFVNDTYLASQSEAYELVVQEEPIQHRAETPLPTEHWTRPISGANRDWATIAGNWLGSDAQPSRVNSYSTGPESAHIMWERSIWAGGIMDGRYGNIPYYDGNNYEHFWSDPIVINGVLYYNVMRDPRYGWYAVDLYSGETLYFSNTTGPVTGITGQYRGFDYSGDLRVGRLAFGQIYNYDSPNQHGGFPYLWSTDGPAPNTWMMYDAFTGNYICSIANVSSPRGAAAVYGKDGSILRYNIAGSGANKRLMVWNTSETFMAAENKWLGSYYGNSFWLYRPYLNHTYNGEYGFSLNVSIPDVKGGIYAVREDEVLIGGSTETDISAGPGIMWYTGNPVRGNLYALDLSDGNEGNLLWSYDYTPPAATTNITSSFGLVLGPMVYPEYDIFLFREGITRKWYGYSLDTGTQLWASESMPAWDYYSRTSHAVYDGKLLSYGYGGQLTAFDICTGEVLWTFDTGSGGFESFYEQTPLSNHVIADGKIYLISTEHSPSKPLRRDAKIWCVDLENGDLLWSILSWGRTPIIADGYLLDMDYFDNQVYCYGKGPSQTTVSMQNDVIMEGSSVMITGTVIDVSEGTKSTELMARFPDGVPAIADASMSAWMEYVYKQQAKPTDAVGVTVKLSAYDPNGNYQDIGTTTSDQHGSFGMSWTPPVPGDYYIKAEFEGSNSYFGSSDTTYMTVEEAPAATPPPDPTPPPMTDTYVLGMGAAALVAIIVIGLIIILLVRRR
jgi:outer membrane protein assembly factor BamB